MNYPEGCIFSQLDDVEPKYRSGSGLCLAKRRDSVGRCCSSTAMDLSVRMVQGVYEDVLARDENKKVSGLQLARIQAVVEVLSSRY